MFLKFDDAIAANYQLTFNDILLEQAAASSLNSRYSSDINPYHRNDFGYYLDSNTKCLPIVGSPMPSIASPHMMRQLLDAPSKPFAMFADRFRPTQELEELYASGCGMTIGLDHSIDDLSDKILTYNIPHVLVDIANGNLDALVSYLTKLQDLRMDEGILLWAGNVTNEYAYSRIAGLVDYVRVGIGGGSACLTRINTGIGAGNVTAISRCAQLRKNLMSFGPHTHGTPSPLAHIVADGGIATNGDICKALACGADLVMLGKMLASTEESASEAFYEDGHVYKKYAGLASPAYNNKTSIEGASGKILLSGSVVDILQGIEGNLRSCMTYTNSKTLEELKSCNKLLCSPTIISENNTSIMR
jgi:IMP dehydrogenase/GMP reductase